ncbi:MAG: hypothetical protein ABIB41_07420 [Nitrospirota bacterium]
MEKENHKIVFGIATYVIRYIATFWSILFYPKRTLSDINSTDLTKPGAFLLINILLSLLVAQFIGYEIAQFPINNPSIQRFTGNSFILVRFFLGLSIFLLILKFFLKWKNLNSFIRLVFPILCYCSVLYLPIILVKHSSYSYIGEDILNIISRATIGLPIQLSVYTYLKFLLLLIMPLIFLLWWLRLIYLGITTLKIDSSVKIKRAIIFSYLLFFVFQTIASLVLFLTINLSTFQGFLIIIDDKVKKELLLNPPNYFKAMVLASKVSENKYMPEYVRYIYKLEKIICTIGFWKGNENLISEGFKGLNDKKYDYVRDVLIDDLKKTSNETIYKNAIRKDVEDAVKLRNSKSFIDFRKEHISYLSFSWTLMPYIEPFSAIMLENGEKTFHVMAPIPRLISLFP